MATLLFFLQITLLLVSLSECVSIYDEIYLEHVDKSFFIKNEVYRFHLRPSYQVPKDIVLHTIYTASTGATQEVTKRYLNRYKRSLDEMAYDDYMILNAYLDGDVPGHVRYDAKKRSLAEETPSGRRILKVSDQVYLTFVPVYTEKRDEVPIGTQLCIHIPFITQCDNSESFDKVKATLEAHIAESNAEIDNIRAVSNARWRDLEATLNKQNALLSSLAATQSNQTASVRKLANIVTYQGLDMAHADNVIAARVKHMQYMTNNVINFANSLQSTDPRAVVAQPALSELFDGYLASIALDQSPPPDMQKYIPIVSNITFDFEEILLPVDAVRNTESVNSTYSDTPSIQGISITIDGVSKRFIGTFSAIHPVIFEQASGDIVSLDEYFGIADTFSGTLRCFSMFGYNVLTDADLTWFGGIKNGPKVEQDITACNIHRLKEGDATLYQFIADFDSRNVQFYSNCLLENLTPLTSATILYLETYSGEYDPLPTPPTIRSIDSQDVNERHFVSADCYINLNPQFIGMTYSIPTNRTRIIPSIPFGYKSNQFTINPAGELSSSLKYVKTTEWLQVYSINRISENSVIVSEVDALVSDEVLFNVNGNTIIDASDSFLDGNNGRNCIIKAQTYDEDIVECTFQNNQNSFPSIPYLRGDSITTGIARFNRKFEFDLQFYDDSNPDLGYELTLTPKGDADFNFHIELGSNICPQLLYRVVEVNRCFFELFWTGSGDPSIDGVSINFEGNYHSQIVLVGESSTLSVGSTKCLTLTCNQANNINSVIVSTPQYDVIPDAILDLVNDKTFTQNITEHIKELALLQEQLRALEEQFLDISAQFEAMNFNISEEITYQNLTDLRNEVLALLQEIEEYEAIAENQEVCGEGIFGNLTCFLEDMLGTLIVIGVIAGILIGTYLLVTVCT